MTWHANNQTEEGSMCHPSNAEVWRHFDQKHPDFAVEPRNVRLDLYTDGFAMHGKYDRTYSCWNKKAFTKNQVERKVARPRLTGEQICDWVEEFSLAVEVPLSLRTDTGSSINGQRIASSRSSSTSRPI
ncbi:UNVERIFIED_CONTAM: hypothetical protein Sradi_4417600 [Sesamum radiatum]|uniref:Uncharacterized protein n=1 Tax=Sesamum radiatum TaxID=300843 RepID=A0AAW2NSN5_SESRA